MRTRTRYCSSTAGPLVYIALIMGEGMRHGTYAVRGRGPGIGIGFGRGEGEPTVL